jgi:hypothetical protein
MEKKQLRQVKQGELFKLKESESAPVWVRDEYDREGRKYLTHKFDDANHWSARKGTLEVFVGFTF